MLEVAATMMREPLHITVKRNEHPLAGIEQSYIVVETDGAKLDILSELYEKSALSGGVIFRNNRRTLEWLEQKFTTRALAIFAMHGDMDAIDRADIQKNFRSSASHVLHATQMLARGMDTEQMTVIVNFDLPANPGQYVHHTGLGHRPNRRSTVINLVTVDDVPRVHEIEQFYDPQIEQRQ